MITFVLIIGLIALAILSGLLILLIMGYCFWVLPLIWKQRNDETIEMTNV